MNIAPLSTKQRRSWQYATARQNIWEGSVRSGKTIASIHAWSEFVLESTADGNNLLMMGRTERTLKRNIIDVLTDMYGRREARLLSGSGEFWLHGRRVYLCGANDVQAEAKVRGMTLYGAYVDEASTVPADVYRQVLNRMSLPGARLFATTNPDSPMHWLKADYLDKARLHLTAEGELVEEQSNMDLARFSFRLHDNETLSPKFIADLEAENTGLWRKRFIEGLWVIAEGAVYDCWEPERHVVAPSQLPLINRLVGVGVDYGTTNPTAGLLVGVSAEERPRLVVVDEWAPEAMTDAGYSADFRRWLGDRAPEWIALDPSAASFKKQLWADQVMNVVGATNAVTDGIRLVSSLLNTDRLVVSASCKHLTAEIPGYCWDAKATAKGEDAPIKQNDHFCDAMRYAVASTRALWAAHVPVTMPTEEAVLT